MKKSKKQPSSDSHTKIIQTKKAIFKLPSNKKNNKVKNFININAYDDSEFHVSVHTIDIYGAQILGSRKTQQDMFAVSQRQSFLSNDLPSAWAVVCDGMGGMSFGEVASQTVNDIMSQVLQSTSINNANIPELLAQSILLANNEVKKIADKKAEIIGTTLVCVVATGNALYYASVGDSRIYICRGNEIAQLTRDHNYNLELTALVEAGEMSEEEALASPQKEALISYMGIDELTLVDISQQPLRMQNGDIVILCSDGLTKVLSDQAILSITNANKNDTHRIVHALLDEVQLDPIRKLDNTTIAVLKYINN